LTETRYPNLRHLRLLDATIRLQSLTKAAAQVHISQPAATQAIARLESLYGEALLISGARGLKATEAGDILRARAVRALQYLSDATGDAARAERLVRQVTISSLRALAAFGEGGSFTGAAVLLGQTEPAVQRAARALERAAGTPLFVSGQRHIALNPTGEGLAEAAGRALRELELAHDDLGEVAGRYTGRLVIGTLPLIRASILPEVLLAFIKHYPDARIEITDGSYQTLMRSLRNGGIDLIIGALRGPSAGVNETALFTDHLAVIARADHPLKGQASLSDAFRYPFVLSRQGTPNRAIYERYAAEFGTTANRGYIETGSHVAARGVLLGSDHLALLSPLQVAAELKAGLLVDLGIALDHDERQIGVTVLKSAQPTQLQQHFLDRLSNYCRTLPRP